ncbi:MAG: HAMP domain-containing protein [Acidobacteriia bacterium]|nr:HAMP domain-containing protein [Terriglobia bacterium]
MKIRHKLLVALLATVLVTSAVVGFGSVQLLHSAVGDRFAERLRAETDLLAASVAALVPPEAPQTLAADAGRRLGARVTLIGHDGTVLGDSAESEADLTSMENHLRRPEIVAAAGGRVGEASRVSNSTGIEYLYTARRVEGNGPVAYVRIALPVARVREVESYYSWLMRGVTLAALLALTAIAYVVVRRLSRPIERMSEAADRTDSGDLGSAVPYDGADELAHLAASINRMKRALVDKIAELDSERAVLRSVIAGMKEGLLLVGTDRRIELANDAFRQIFGVPFDPAGHLLAEAIRNPAVIRDLDHALGDGAEVREMVVRAADSGRSFEVHVTPLPSRPSGRPGGALVLFFDISRLVALEAVRRDFVADVSHELRTPLTSIRAFVETLLDGGLADRENAARFLEIARRHAARMETLIDDLTDLSLIETGAIELLLEDVEVAEVAGDVADEVSHRHASAGIRVEVDFRSPFVLRADRRRFEQILVNLVDNGIKFNRPGGVVRVTGGLEGGRPTISVEDTGVGIPADSLEKIFNRFYRVDKARSREMGGTGLGLAIVRHLMRLHGGAVRAESELGRGSRFVLEFPPA